VAGVATGATAAVLAAHVLERAGDYSLAAVYVVTGFAILTIGACFAELKAYMFEGPDARGNAAYRVFGSWQLFFLAVIPLTLAAVLGYSAAHLGDWLLGRPEPVACGVLGAGVGAIVYVPVRRTCLWWLGPAPTEEEPEA
jgi:hypothetical protein